MALFSLPRSQSAISKKTGGHSGCGMCLRNKKCKTPNIPPSGSGDKGILIINSHPSREDDRTGIHLSDDVGEEFEIELRKIGISLRQDCWVISAVGCYAKEALTDSQVSWCQPSVMRFIEENKPRTIIILGIAGIQSIMKDRWHKNLGGIKKWRGFCCPDRALSAWVCPIDHPAYVFKLAQKEPVILKILRDDLKRAFSTWEMDLPEWEDEKKDVQILHSSKEIRIYLQSVLDSPPEFLAFDYETTGLKLNADGHRIISCSMCYDGWQGTAWMWDKMNQSCLELFKEILQIIEIGKIASNIKYEDNATMAQLNYDIRGWIWDTMLAGHTMDNRSGITSIKFLAYLHLGVVPWNEHVEDLLESDGEEGGNSFNRIDEIDPLDLLVYNALDSVYEYQVAMKQMEVVE